jgi:hypothetical protein
MSLIIALLTILFLSVCFFVMWACNRARQFWIIGSTILFTECAYFKFSSRASSVASGKMTTAACVESTRDRYDQAFREPRNCGETVRLRTVWRKIIFLKIMPRGLARHDFEKNLRRSWRVCRNFFLRTTTTSIFWANPSAKFSTRCLNGQQQTLSSADFEKSGFFARHANHEEQHQRTKK